MVWGPKRSPVGQLAAGEFPSYRRDHRDFEQFLGRQRRQDRREALRQHRLSRAGRPDHQKVVPASRGHFEGALGALLPFNVAKVRQAARRCMYSCLGPRQHLRSAKVVGDGDEAAGGDDVKIRTSPGGLRSRFMRADQAFADGIGAYGGGQRTRDRRDRAIKRQLSQHDVLSERIAGNRAQAGHQPQGNR